MISNVAPEERDQKLEALRSLIGCAMLILVMIAFVAFLFGAQYWVSQQRALAKPLPPPHFTTIPPMEADSI